MVMNSQKVVWRRLLSFRRRPESSEFNKFWMPDQVRHDGFETFYEHVNDDGQKKRIAPCGAFQICNEA
jgi:hypothetical protein